MNENHLKLHHLLMLCFLFTLTGPAADYPNRISINCGGAAAAAALTGREWLRDAAPQGSSTPATMKGELITAVDPVPYKTARISRSKFSYSFPMSPGQKFIRLHFNPAFYHGFQSFNDLFTVEAGPFLLLANFSASVTARALSVNTFVKEFCVTLQENQSLNIVFSPESKNNYAFINGIEIISVSSAISFCHGGDTAVRVLGQKHKAYVDNTTALEIVHRQNIKWASSASSDDEIGSLFGMLGSTLKENANETYNKSWGVSVDVGFRYLVRLHLCELGIKLHSDFMLLINNITVLTSADHHHHHHMLQQRGDQSIHWYNFMVMVEGKKREGKRRIAISQQSQHQFLDRHGPFEGFEVFKLSNHDCSLASPNPLLPSGETPSQTIHTLLCSLVGRRNAIATYVVTFLCLVCTIVHLVNKFWGPHLTGEDNNLSSRSKQLIPCISLAKIIAATENFHEGFVIGKGGFSKVYKALMFMGEGRKNVAIKRLKQDSKHGEHQFWTEVETLSGVKHANIITLIGYCKEQQEMILVYELMPRGTLADHLYKLAKKINDFNPLSWKERLSICIGAARALDYLHTGLGIIHRDVKASNILLDEESVAILSDFGLAKAGIGGESQNEDGTRIRGTIGYMDPSYCRTGKVTEKSDTYSFGVVLLAVLCGRPAWEPWNEEDKRSLSTWAIDNIRKGQVDVIVAPSLRGEISPDSLKTFVKIAERCLHYEPEQRPAMIYVVIKLQLALQQQEGSGAGDVSLSTQKSRDNICVANALPQKENARSSAQNGIANATPDKSHQERAKSMSSDEKTRVGSELPGNVLTDTSYLTVIKDGISSMIRRILRRLGSWKASSRKDFVGISESAPIPYGSSNITLVGK